MKRSPDPGFGDGFEGHPAAPQLAPQQQEVQVVVVVRAGEPVQLPHDHDVQVGVPGDDFLDDRGAVFRQSAVPCESKQCLKAGPLQRFAADAFVLELAHDQPVSLKDKLAVLPVLSRHGDLLFLLKIGRDAGVGDHTVGGG